jgi:DUF2934 family protein
LPLSDEISIRRFMWLLDQRGHAFLDERRLEQAIPIRNNKRPDFFVDTRRNVRFLAEVKAFEKPTALDQAPPSIGSIFIGDLQERINSGAISHAAEQLAPYRHDPLPRVVVLDNHRQIGISLDTVTLIQIFGTLQYEFAINTETGASVSEGWAHSNKDYAVGDKRRSYISAVAVNIPTRRFDTFDGTVDDFTVPRPMRVHVIHNPDATHPLPLWVFSEPDDKQIIMKDNRWIEFFSPPAEVRHADIARRAYDHFTRRGGQHGHDVDDWLAAEREARDAIGEQR